MSGFSLSRPGNPNHGCKLLRFGENDILHASGDRQTDEQTDGQHRCVKPLSLTRDLVSTKSSQQAMHRGRIAQCQYDARRDCDH